ncbi:MAG: aminotransferase class I/II-fold pyridoxal phosphate-dependent enzyme [Gemmatimonadota bacterium]|nr:aminotransferase class I/II-fold pyridoxal phosphate-dependent enzyme [Gemmatimonadota bacterium]
MSLSRRAFCRTIGAVAPLSFLDASVAMPAIGPGRPSPSDGLIHLDNNENPYGPSPAARATAAQAIAEGGRYPGDAVTTLIAKIAAANAVAPDNVLLTVGATEALIICAKAFTRPDGHLVTAAPSYATIASATERIGNKVVRVPIRADGALDLDAMVAQARGAGLVYICNPNNPTGMIAPAQAIRDLVARVGEVVPTAIILIGEAYHEYIDVPAYASAAPDTTLNARLLVSRTFSKLYGLAGLRLGYVIGLPEPLQKLTAHRVGLGANIVAVAAATAALGDDAERLRQRRLTKEGRERTLRFFKERGWRTYPAEANYVFADVRRDIGAFRAACQAQGVLIGRAYPPTDTWARITIGTPDEMDRALPILERVLAT